MAQCQLCHSLDSYPGGGYTGGIRKRYFTWTDDPIKTENGLAGEDYKGLIDVSYRHILELQNARRVQEPAVGILSNNRTQFTSISAGEDPNKIHIEELRESTEKILDKLGFTLTQYFNYEIEVNFNRTYYIGIYYGTYRFGEKVADQTDWTDVDRSTGQPSLLSITKIKAIHIEELRHQIPTVEEISVPELYLEPPNISFNLRCLTQSRIEIKAYLGGMDVTRQTSFQIYNTLVARLVYEWDYDLHELKVFVEPVGVGNTTIFANSYWYGIPVSANGLIIVSRSVGYAGDMTGDYWDGFTGTGTGCDGTSLTATWKSSRISGQFDGVDFRIPMSTISNYRNYYAEDPPGQLKYLGSSLSDKLISDPPEYMEGTYRRILDTYIRSDVGIAYAINNYKVSGEVNIVENGTWEYILEDVNKDGVMDTYVLHVEMGSVVASFNMEFRYDPSI